MMYHPDTGEEVKVANEKEHEKYAKLGYGHDKPMKESDEVEEGSIKGSGKDMKAKLKKAFRAGEMDTRAFNRGGMSSRKPARNAPKAIKKAYERGRLSNDGSSALTGKARMKSQDRLGLRRESVDSIEEANIADFRYDIENEYMGSPIFKGMKIKKGKGKQVVLTVQGRDLDFTMKTVVPELTGTKLVDLQVRGRDHVGIYEEISKERLSFKAWDNKEAE